MEADNNQDHKGIRQIHGEQTHQWVSNLSGCNLKTRTSEPLNAGNCGAREGWEGMVRGRDRSG